jgi:hypothetical protein
LNTPKNIFKIANLLWRCLLGDIFGIKSEFRFDIEKGKDTILNGLTAIQNLNIPLDFL